MAVDWAQVREQFPSLAHWTYLNTATYGQLPRRASEAVSAHFGRRDRLACTDFLTWFDDADDIRAAVGKLIGSAPEDIAFFPSASTALATVMNGIDWRPGDRIVALEGEFPNNLYAPAARRTQGVEFCETSWERFYEEVDRGARLVLMSTANYTTGFRPPVAEIARRLRDRGILFYLDGTQSIGALRFDCAGVDPDFLAVDAYKWLLGPNGSGFLYVRPDVRRWLRPSVVGWRSDYRWRSVNALHHGEPEFSDAAEKYEGGMIDFPSLYGMGASVGMMLEIGPEQIEARILGLSEECRGVLEKAGGRVQHRNTAILAARFEGIDAAALCTRLAERKIIVSARHGNLRVSVHFYNDESDLEALARGLAKVR